MGEYFIDGNSCKTYWTPINAVKRKLGMNITGGIVARACETGVEIIIVWSWQKCRTRSANYRPVAGQFAHCVVLKAVFYCKKSDQCHLELANNIQVHHEDPRKRLM